jgi:ATP-dependent RNA helicase DDX19/DBP5
MNSEDETKKPEEATVENTEEAKTSPDGDTADVVAKAELKKKKDDSEELTKRLQKLALERQKQTSGDRLKVIQSDTSSHLSGAKTFQELNLPTYLLDAIFAMGFDRPSAIQEEALPRILADPPRNLIGQAQSGSGKTAAFTLGMLYRIVVDDPPTTQALCVTPTRELAIQIFQKAVKPMAANMMGLKIQLAIAGTTIERGKTVDAHLVIGTPGKVVDWLKRRTIKTNTVKVFVLDEADNMVAENGFRANSLVIKKAVPNKCQTLLFSATFPEDVVNFADKMVYKPDKILIESEESLVSGYFGICRLEGCISFIRWTNEGAVTLADFESPFPLVACMYRSWMSSNSFGSIRGHIMEES